MTDTSSTSVRSWATSRVTSHNCLGARRFAAFCLFGLYVLYAQPVVQASETDSWQFTLAPYLWGAGISGSTAAGGIEPPPLNPGNSFFALQNLDAAGFLYLSARKGRWGIESNVLRISFSDDFDVGPLNTSISLGATVLEIGGVYQPAPGSSSEWVFGLRGLSVDVAVELVPGLEASGDDNWVDPFVGLRHRWPFSERWSASLHGDIGGFGVASKLTINAIASLSYELNPGISALLGYRYTSFDFKEGDFLVDIEASGVWVAVSFSF